jgi:hypothetical protein
VKVTKVLEPEIVVVTVQADVEAEDEEPVTE